ncbi:MAG: zinc ribbon domain-containing protein [Desulfobacteraceae bacterium]|nr:zinc ribbon domain-containing protein [Desulfobacteraceae bacterium]
MPIYEYECLQCKEVIEAVQKFSDAPMTTCPHCSGELKKLISSSSFLLKGGGWYADGYSSSGSGCGKAAGKNGCGGGEGTKKGTGCSGSACGCS